MADPSDNETWLIDAGDLIVEKMQQCGLKGLTTWEQLVYGLWVADYGMRNAGDLKMSAELHPRFQTDASRLAVELSLALTKDLFSMPRRRLEKCYFDQFDAICTEIRAAEPAR